jgi:tRNA-specific 2-thiouridylase
VNSHPQQLQVTVGLSGGVDSSVAAALLKQQGYQLNTAFMKNWSGDDFGIQADCPWEADQKSAELAAQTLDLAFRSYNFEKEYRSQVVDYFFSEYQKGRTPNPDIMCNKAIKFDVFLHKAAADGADLIATGHYAQREYLPELDEYLLRRGVDHNKDQSYFLAGLSQEQLSKALFPIGHLTKPEVRKLAAEFGLPNFSRPDSQGICFIGEIDVREFLRKHISTKPGAIIDIDTNQEVGGHDGVYYYTIGQREGLGIGGQAVPYFVVDKDAEQNILYVAHGHNHPALNKQQVLLENLHVISPKYWQRLVGGRSEVELIGMARYRQSPQPGKLNIAELTFTFTQPQRALTPGQTLALFNNDILVAAGTIATVI